MRRNEATTTPHQAQWNEKENRSKQLLRCDSWSDDAKDDRSLVFGATATRMGAIYSTGNRRQSGGKGYSGEAENVVQHMRRAWQKGSSLNDSQPTTSHPIPGVERSAIVQAPLLPLQMGGGGEGFGQALFRSVGIEDLGSVRLLLVHNARVFELFNQRLLALVIGIAHLENFFARIHVPLNAQSFLGEVQQVLDRNEIDEGITDVATILEIHSEIHEIDSTGADLGDERQQVLVTHLVRDVLNHDRGPCVQSLFDFVQIELVLFGDRGRWNTRSTNMEGGSGVR